MQSFAFWRAADHVSELKYAVVWDNNDTPLRQALLCHFRCETGPVVGLPPEGVLQSGTAVMEGREETGGSRQH